MAGVCLDESLVYPAQGDDIRIHLTAVHVRSIKRNFTAMVCKHLGVSYGRIINTTATPYYQFEPYEVHKSEIFQNITPI